MPLLVRLATYTSASWGMPRKIELMGEYTCPRWHQDSYCGRAITTYNVSGTNYTADVPS